MAYAQYQTAQPAWGPPGSQYPVPGAPHISTPTYQPQSTWGGVDFYRAHAPSNNDPALFNHAWDRVRQFDAAAAPGGQGVGLGEAKHWHRRAYGGVGNELNSMPPTEIGHAAAYEAFRTSMRDRSLLETMGPDIERQREALIGLAVAEASRLLSYTGRSMDHYSRSVASDAAAHTASLLFYQRRQDRESRQHYRRGRSRSRRRYEDYDDYDRDYDREHDRDYDDDDDEDFRYDGRDRYDDRYRGRSRSRRRSHSRPRAFSEHGGQMPYGGSSYPTGTPYPSMPGLPPGAVPSYAGSDGGGMLGSVPPPSAMSASGFGAGYASSAPFHLQPSAYSHPQTMYTQGVPAQVQYVQPGFPQTSMPVGSQPQFAPAMGVTPSMSSSSGYTYGSQPLMPGIQPQGTVTIPGQTIIVQKSRRHRDKHRRHHSRSE